MKTVLVLLARSVLLPFGLLAAMSATDSAIQIKIHRTGNTVKNGRRNENN